MKYKLKYDATYGYVFDDIDYGSGSTDQYMIKYLEERYCIVGAFNPNSDEWYSVAHDCNNSNFVLHFDWRNGHATKYQISTQQSLISFAKITRLVYPAPPAGDDMPIEGYFTGQTDNQESSDAMCNHSFTS